MPSQSVNWTSPPEHPALDDEEVHIWRVHLVQPAGRIYQLQQILSTDEINRAARFHFQRDRERFIAARGMLRVILGRYLKAAPSQLSFSYSEYGKPRLCTEANPHGLSFNVSHSHELALCAITRGREIGIDIEYMRSEMTGDEIAERFFSAKEAATLRALPADLRIRAFFNCWTRKESYIKARGEGLSFPLERFEVSMVPGEPAALLNVYDDPHEASRWSMQELFAGPNYASAVIVQCRQLSLKLWDADAPDLL